MPVLRVYRFAAARAACQASDCRSPERGGGGKRRRRSALATADGGTAETASHARTGGPRPTAPPHSVTVQACAARNEYRLASSFRPSSSRPPSRPRGEPANPGRRLHTAARQDLKADAGSSRNPGKKIMLRFSSARYGLWRAPGGSEPGKEGLAGLGSAHDAMALFTRQPAAGLAAGCRVRRRACHRRAGVSASCGSPRAETSLIRAPRAWHACGSRRPAGPGRGFRPSDPPHAAGSAPFPPGRSP